MNPKDVVETLAILSAGTLELATRPEPLSDDEARDLAARWAVWQTDAVKLVNQLTDDEREGLFAWVRARMADPAWALIRQADEPEAREEFAHGIAQDLDIVAWESCGDDCDADYTAGWVLCKAAGWPS